MSFEIRETTNKILSFFALIPLKSLLLPSGSHIVSCFSARAEIPFQLQEIFSDFLARLAGLKILARFDRARIFSPGWIPLHVIDNLILSGFVSEARLKFQLGTGLKFAK